MNGFDAVVQEEVLQVASPAVRWLSTGYNGGYRDAPAVYNVTVPTDWDRTDLDTYARERRRTAERRERVSDHYLD